MPRIMDNVISGGIGAAAGVGSYFVDKKDAERAAAGPLPVMKQYGTWYHYAIPGIATVLSLLNIVKGDWQTRLISVGYTLAGRKASEQIEVATAQPPAGRSSADRARAEAQRRAQLEAQRRAALASSRGTSYPLGLYVEEEEILS